MSGATISFMVHKTRKRSEIPFENILLHWLCSSSWNECDRCFPLLVYKSSAASCISKMQLAHPPRWWHQLEWNQTVFDVMKKIIRYTDRYILSHYYNGWAGREYVALAQPRCTNNRKGPIYSARFGIKGGKKNKNKTLFFIMIDSIDVRISPAPHVPSNSQY